MGLKNLRSILNDLACNVELLTWFAANKPIEETRGIKMIIRQTSLCVIRLVMI